MFCSECKLAQTQNYNIWAGHTAGKWPLPLQWMGDWGSWCFNFSLPLHPGASMQVIRQSDSVTSTALSIVAIVVSAKPSHFWWLSSPASSYSSSLNVLPLVAPSVVDLAPISTLEGVTCGGLPPMAMWHWWWWLGKLVEAWATRCDWPGAKCGTTKRVRTASKHPRRDARNAPLRCKGAKR